MKRYLLLIGSVVLVLVPQDAYSIGGRNERGGHGGFAGGSGRAGGGGGARGGGGEGFNRAPSFAGAGGERGGGEFRRPSGGNGMVPHGRPGGGAGENRFEQGGGNRMASRPNYELPRAGDRPGAGGGGERWQGGGERPNGSQRPGQGGAGERWPGGGQANRPSRPGQGGSGERWPGGNAERPNFPDRPGQGGAGERWPNGGERPNFPDRPGQGGAGERWPNGGGQANWPSRPGQGGSGERWPNGGNRPNWPNQGGNGNRTNIGDRNNFFNNPTNIGDRTNINNGNINSGNQQVNFNNTNNINNTAVGNRNWNGQGHWQNNNWYGAHNYWNNHYAGWHHGNWNNWNGHPAAWYGAGLSTGWLASAGDAYVYSNPFYAGVPSVSYNTYPSSVDYNYVDYSQPIPQPPQQVSVTYNEPSYAVGYDQGAVPAADGQVADTSAPPAGPPSDGGDQGPPPEAFQRFTDARAAFKANDYSKALKDVDRAIKLSPSDVAMHEFRGLVLFAQRQYKEAAASVYAVLSAGPGWTWDTVRDLYSDPELYTKQLRALEKYSRDNPKASDGHFLLGYEYLVLNHVPAALNQLKDFTDLAPQDKLVPQIIAAFSQPASSQASADSQTAAPTQAQPQSGQP